MGQFPSTSVKRRTALGAREEGIAAQKVEYNTVTVVSLNIDLLVSY